MMVTQKTTRVNQIAQIRDILATMLLRGCGPTARDRANTCFGFRRGTAAGSTSVATAWAA